MLTIKFIHHRVGIVYTSLENKVPFSQFFGECVQGVIESITHYYPEEDVRRYIPYIEDRIFSRIADDFSLEYTPMSEEDKREIFSA